MIGLEENLIAGTATAGLSVYFGANSAYSGINRETYKALYGRDGREIDVEYELWKEEQEWKRKNGFGQ